MDVLVAVLARLLPLCACTILEGYSHKKRAASEDAALLQTS